MQPEKTLIKIRAKLLLLRTMTKMISYKYITITKYNFASLPVFLLAFSCKIICITLEKEYQLHCNTCT